MTRVKICGLRDPQTALEAAKAGADFISMVFAESRRRVTPQECHDIGEAIREARARGQQAPITEFDGPGHGEVSGATWYGAWNEAIEDALARWRPLVVGVFADQTAAEVNDIAEASGIDIVQLSGGESREFVMKIARPVLHAIHVHDGMDAYDVFDAGQPGAAAAVMLDTAVEGAKGGSGIAFDWSIAAEVAGRWPLMLAGGLSLENVARAVAAVEPWAVDVSSGVERDGKKDIEMIRAFIRAAKGAQVGS